MKEFEFTLVFAVPAPVDVDRLYEEGCSDALIGIGRKGHIALDFIREAHSAAAAKESAIEAVKRAIPGAELAEVSYW